MNAVVNPNNNLIVSVCMITYNHEAFIGQAIESVLMQQTGFSFELVIGEDCSTDNTRAIVCEYANRNPDRIRLLLPACNQGMVPNFIRTLKACQGKYIALCEGDDYWADPLKLQKQVDLMEAHSDYSVCFHRIYRLDQTTGKKEVWKQSRRLTKPFYTLDDIVRGHFVATASIMLRNGLVPELPIWFKNCQRADWMLLILYAQHGRMGFIDQSMSVYRVHEGGVFSGATIQERYIRMMNTIETLRRYLGPKYKKLIRVCISEYLDNLAATCADSGDMVNAKAYFRKGISGFPFCYEARIIDKLVLFCRLYTPLVYRTLKEIYIST